MVSPGGLKLNIYNKCTSINKGTFYNKNRLRSAMPEGGEPIVLIKITLVRNVNFRYTKLSHNPVIFIVHDISPGLLQ